MSFSPRDAVWLLSRGDHSAAPWGLYPSTVVAVKGKVVTIKCADHSIPVCTVNIDGSMAYSDESCRAKYRRSGMAVHQAWMLPLLVSPTREQPCCRAARTSQRRRKPRMSLADHLTSQAMDCVKVCVRCRATPI